MNLKQCCCFFLDEGQGKIQKNSRDYPWEMYTLKELLRATKDFHQDNKIGEGGFGSVYFGRTSKGVQVIIFIISFSPQFELLFIIIKYRTKLKTVS
uniref:Uncharacterized protein n=1 Tax=Cajanus cajan TaxID=3821 RepID=A0A151QYZ1_CAJCA|nr:hypothetical protein KK1_043378 [Cajanus cajan]